VLDLSNCSLTDAACSVLGGILTAQSNKRAELNWIHGLRGSSGADAVKSSSGMIKARGAMPQQFNQGDRPYCIQKLLLSGTPRITDAGAQQLARALQSSCSISSGGLQELELRCCKLLTVPRSVGLFRAALADMTRSAAARITVDLRGSGDGDESGAAAGAGQAEGQVLWGPLQSKKPGRRVRHPAAGRVPPVKAASSPKAAPSRDTSSSDTTPRDTADRQRRRSEATVASNKERGASARETLVAKRGLPNAATPLAQLQHVSCLKPACSGRLALAFLDDQSSLLHLFPLITLPTQSFKQAQALVDGLEARLMLLLPSPSPPPGRRQPLHSSTGSL